MAATARLAQPAERKALNLVVVASSPTWVQCLPAMRSQHNRTNRTTDDSARSVAASYKPPMLVTRVRLPVCATMVTIGS